MGVPERDERQKDVKSLFKEIIAKSFHKLRKDMIIHLQEAQLTPNKINSKRLYQGTF